MFESIPKSDIKLLCLHRALAFDVTNEITGHVKISLDLIGLVHYLSSLTRIILWSPRNGHMYPKSPGILSADGTFQESFSSLFRERKLTITFTDIFPVGYYGITELREFADHERHDFKRHSSDIVTSRLNEYLQEHDSQEVYDKFGESFPLSTLSGQKQLDSILQQEVEKDARLTKENVLVVLRKFPLGIDSIRLEDYHQMYFTRRLENQWVWDQPFEYHAPVVVRSRPQVHSIYPEK